MTTIGRRAFIKSARDAAALVDTEKLNAPSLTPTRAGVQTWSTGERGYYVSIKRLVREKQNG